LQQETRLSFLSSNQDTQKSLARVVIFHATEFAAHRKKEDA